MHNNNYQPVSLNIRHNTITLPRCFLFHFFVNPLIYEHDVAATDPVHHAYIDVRVPTKGGACGRTGAMLLNIHALRRRNAVQRPASIGCTVRRINTPVSRAPRSRALSGRRILLCSASHPGNAQLDTLLL